MRAITRALLASSILSTSCLPVAPYTIEGTAGKALENEFRTEAARCGLPVPKNATAIPNLLRVEYDQDLRDKKVTMRDRDSMNKLFRFAFTTEELGEFDQNRLDLDRYFGSTTSDSALASGREGSAYALYQYSCVGMLKAAIDADVAVPTTDIKGAISADYQQTSRYGLVQGSFDSPLSLGLNSTSATVRINTLLDLWQTYRARQGFFNFSDPTRKYFYLSAFEGWAVAAFSSSSRAEKVDASANFGYGTVSVTTQAQVQATGNISSETRTNAFKTYIYQDNSAVRFRPLPKPEEIVNELSKIAKLVGTPIPKYDFASTTSRQRHRLSLGGVPRDLCDSAFWTIDPNIPDGRLKLFAVGMENESCSFFVEFEPNAQALGKPYFSIEYNIKSNEALADRTLTLPASALISTSVQPKVSRALSFPADYVRQTTGSWTSLTYDIPFTIEDDQVHIKRPGGAHSISKAVIKCGDNRLYQIQDVRLKTPEMEGGKFFILHAEYSVPQGVDLPKTQSVQCMLDAILNLELANAPTPGQPMEERALQAKVMFPNFTTGDTNATPAPQ